MSTLLLSGWAQPADALAHLAADAVLFDYSDYTPPEAIEAIRGMQGERIIAWSLGGQLALQAIAAGMMPRHLTLIASPHQFVSGGEIQGMDPLTFRLFRESYAKDPARTKTRFHALTAKGDREPKRIIAQLHHHPDVEHTSRWLPWLDALGEAAIEMSTLASAPPTLIIHGMNDAIVPFSQGEYIARHLPNATVSGWPDCCHAPHLHDAARAVREIAQHRAAHGVA